LNAVPEEKAKPLQYAESQSRAAEHQGSDFVSGKKQGFGRFWQMAEDKKLWGLPKSVDQQPKALPFPSIPMTTVPFRVAKSTVLSRAT